MTSDDLHHERTRDELNQRVLQQQLEDDTLPKCANCQHWADNAEGATIRRCNMPENQMGNATRYTTDLTVCSAWKPTEAKS